MKPVYYLLICSLAAGRVGAQTDTIVYHPVKLDINGKILPWNYDNPAKAWFTGANRP